MVTKVSKSEILEDGLCVWFGDDGNDETYYAHAMRKLGTPLSSDAQNTVWGWVNHMSHKIWWKSVEIDFWKEVNKHFKI